jgi:NAD(P)-dependent dehydrogenase (short-subunit alcohol dehydrogenase family)
MTESMASGFPEGADMTLIAHLARPDWKFGQPEDIASVITMLLSDDAKHINGEVVRIDGGTHS